VISAPLRRGVLVGAIILAAVLIPFFLLGDAVEAFVVDVLERPIGRTLLAGFAVLALASDVLLPIPSSLVATALGAVFGATTGALLSTVGLTLGCAAGFALGRFAGQGLAARRLGPDLPFMRGLVERYGAAALVLCRGVPVLAEASVIAAGLLGMPLGRFLAATTLANLGVSAVYASLGAAAIEGSAVAAFVAAIALPAVLLAAAALGRRLIARPKPAPAAPKPE
jgi:uncharacterized membrane protein YdjX (TVP38/TMEM64 family)